MERIILHCDLNNFYASVECLYRPEIRNLPVAVCGSQELRHGIVLAKNNLAKKAGVKTGEPIWKARQRCPNIFIAPPNNNLYLRFSRLVREIYKNYTEYIEAFGIDECWLDVTNNMKNFESPEKLAYEIKDRIKLELGITASIGVSFNKIFAKLGSDIKKPDAVTCITKENFKEIVWKLPVEDLLYVGHSTKRKLNNIGIYKIGELAKFPVDFLKARLGKWGETIWIFANGYDNTPVIKNEEEAVIKGIGNSLTAPRDLTCNDEVKALFYVLSESVGERLRRANFKGKTIQISIKNCELEYIERQGQFNSATFISGEIAQKAYSIFLNSWNWDKNIRALGVRITNLTPIESNYQISFLNDEIKKQKCEKIERCVDNIRSRYGHYSIGRALMFKDNYLNANPVEENIIHPISYFKGDINYE